MAAHGGVVLPALEVAFTYCAGVSQTSSPRSLSSRAQKCGRAASIPPSVQPGEEGVHLATLQPPLGTTEPSTAIACTWKTCSARSSPIILISMTDGSLLVTFDSHHRGTLMS